MQTKKPPVTGTLALADGEQLTKTSGHFSDVFTLNKKTNRRVYGQSYFG